MPVAICAQCKGMVRDSFHKKPVLGLKWCDCTQRKSNQINNNEILIMEKGSIKLTKEAERICDEFDKKYPLRNSKNNEGKQ